MADVVAHRKSPGGESSPSGWPRRRTAGEFAWGGDHTETLGYSCAKLWDKVGYKVLQDVRRNAIFSDSVNPSLRV